MKRATQKNERFVVGRRGEPSVVIMSVKDFIDTIAPAPDWLKRIQTASKRRGTDQLSMRQINSVIAETRRERSKRKINQKGR